MLIGRYLGFIAMAITAVACSSSIFEPDPPKTCSSCEQWNQPQAPYQIFANTYYVGTAGLAAILIVSNDGLILIDGGLSQSAELIDASIRELGFHTRDIKLILNSHAHYDHAGGLAALQRFSNAQIMASPESAIALLQGGLTEDDPQYGFGQQANEFPAVDKVDTFNDRETITVGDVSLTPYFTPGHTLGSTTWVWQSCQEEQCLNLVYADSINPVSAPEFRFFAEKSKIDYRVALQNNIDLFNELDCDILLAPHPFYFEMNKKLKQRQQSAIANPFIDPNACKAYAAVGANRIQERLSEEQY